MDADRRNDTGIFRYTDVEYTPEGHTDAYRWDDFLGIAGGHVYSAMDTIDMVSTGGQYEGDEPEHAYACEIVGCCGLSDGVALFRPVSHDGADLIQIAFLRNDVDDATGAYTERFEAGSFDLPAADLPRSEFGVDLLEYFSGRSFKYTPGVSRGLGAREAVDSIEDAIGCDLGLFDGFWLGVPGEADMRVGPYTKQSLLDFSYYAKELSCRYGFADSDILEIARHLPEECPDRLAAVKAYLDCEYVPDGDAPDEKTYRWGDFLEIAGGDARYAAMLVDRTAAGEPGNGADTGYRQLDSDFVNASNSWDEVYGFIKRSDPNSTGMPASFDYALLALDSNGWHFGESNASAFDIPAKDLDFFLGIFYCSSISEFAAYASECNEPDFQEWLCSMYLRDQVEDRLRHEISCNCIQSTVDAFKLLSDKIGFEFEPENNPANVAKAASAAAVRSVGFGLSEAEGIKH